MIKQSFEERSNQNSIVKEEKDMQTNIRLNQEEVEIEFEKQTEDAID